MEQSKSRPDINQYLPLNQTDYINLLSLIESSPNHGYNLIKEHGNIASFTGTENQSGVATIYRRLKYLNEMGFIESLHKDSDPEPRVEKFSITELGRLVAIAETARLTLLLEYANNILQPPTENTETE